MTLNLHIIQVNNNSSQAIDSIGIEIVTLCNMHSLFHKLFDNICYTSAKTYIGRVFRTNVTRASRNIWHIHRPRDANKDQATTSQRNGIRSLFL